ncbi:hypothetical protein MKW94_006198 [Papaver nudicaule]|uniref:Uncharacterized protein n=1 Tax=Papaver nudicaule TaxID=74823 RepID=A0AA41VCQ3_PAPNU|nr:hypothetical protein [Papaver nudicaule]
MDVDELIKAAQDELLLKLSINSHTTTNNLDLDLLHRFQALKSTKTPSVSSSKTADSSSAKVSLPTTAKKEGSDSGAGLLDLDSRFNALKNKSGSTATAAEIGRLGLGDDGSDGGDEDDEVEKLIRWAKDAARLDPSPPSDDDDAGGDDREDDSDDDDLEVSDDTDDEEEEIRKKSKARGAAKVKGTKKR